MPTKTSRTSLPTRSGTLLPRAASSSVRVNPTAERAGLAPLALVGRALRVCSGGCEPVGERFELGAHPAEPVDDRPAGPRSHVRRTRRPRMRERALELAREGAGSGAQLLLRFLPLYALPGRIQRLAQLAAEPLELGDDLRLLFPVPVSGHCRKPPFGVESPYAGRYSSAPDSTNSSAFSARPASIAAFSASPCAFA